MSKICVDGISREMTAKEQAIYDANCAAAVTPPPSAEERLTALENVVTDMIFSSL